ncbi:MAG: FG-GAP repeat domain-containing protein [Acidobacteriota bacterium]
MPAPGQIEAQHQRPGPLPSCADSIPAASHGVHQERWPPSAPRPTRFTAGFPLFCLLLMLLPSPLQARRVRALDLRRLELEIGGPPVAILPADLDGDGRLDLLVVTAFTHWDQIGRDHTYMADGRLVQEVEVTAILADRREYRLFLGQQDGSYRPAGPAQTLPASVLAFDGGPSGQPILALTTSGVSAVRLQAGSGQSPLSLEPLIEDRPVLAPTGMLLAHYRFTGDVDGDHQPDLLLATPGGLAIYMSREGRLGAQPASRIRLPGSEKGKDGVVWNRLSRPQILDLNGDSLPDLLVIHKSRGQRLVGQRDGDTGGTLSVLKGLGDGRFALPQEIHRVPDRALRPEPGAGEAGTSPAAEPTRPADGPAPAGSSEDHDQPVDRKNPDEGPASGRKAKSPQTELPGQLQFLGDLDGDGRAEMVTGEPAELGDDTGFRKGMREFKSPHYTYRFYHVTPAFQVERHPYLELRVRGWPFDFDWLSGSPGGFIDLDGDGLMDLVMVDLDFSLWQIPKVLIARTIGAGLEFHIWKQGPGPAFREVRDSRLPGKLKIDLHPLRLAQFAQFAGDFNGDHRIEFVQMTSGRKIRIHGGQAGAHYPMKADLTLSLAAAPDNPGLVKVRDFDGDGRSDLLVMTRLPSPEEGESPPTRLEFYMTGGPQ